MTEKELRAENVQLKQQLAEALKMIAKLEKENKKLQGQLGKFLNENTPPGSVPPYLKEELEAAFPPETSEAQEKEDEGKQAKLPNTRNKRPKPDKTKTHKIDTCPKCKRKLRPLGKKQRKIVIHFELPKAEAIEHISNGGYCADCKERFYASVPDTLPNSKYSLDTAIFIVTLAIAYNMTQRKIAELLGRFGIPISPASVNNVYHNVKKYLGDKKYREFEQELKNSMHTNADDTSHRHKGKNFWIRLVKNAKIVFIRLSKTHNSKDTKTLPLGKYSTTDGYRGYDKAGSILQRCWAKVSRKARNPKFYFTDEWEIEQYKNFVADLFKIYHDAKHTIGRGKDIQKMFDKRLKELLLKPRKEERNLLRLMNYLLEYEGEWFTFLLRNGITPTNNPAEIDLRPLVIKRKISQHTWSEDGLRCLENFYTLEETCKKRGADFADLLRHEIEGNLAEMRKT
ncbi:IS66 family transposase [Candidatus Dependentiae bacterium]|nr:IS66 family transposase [Candidatus Dependentiae bacterium]